MYLSELSSNRAFRVLTLLLVVSIVLAAFPLGGAMAQAPVPSEQGPSGHLHQVRSLEMDEHGERLSYIRDALSQPDINGARGRTVNPSNNHVFLLDPAAQAIQELSPAGELIASYPYSDFGLRDPQAIVFAPSADQTDDAGTMHLYVADAGESPYQANIQELSFEPALDLLALPAATSSLYLTIDTSKFSTASNPLAANPSPDPSGITFLLNATQPLSSTLLISDSEVEEPNFVPGLFKGQNVFQTTLTGTLVSGTSLVATTGFSNEPTGLAWNKNNNHLFVSDDDAVSVFEANLGTGNVYRSFSTSEFTCFDPEGVAYDPARNELLIADGINSEVYRITPGPNGVFDGTDDVVTHFDTGALGFTDLEGIDVDPVTGEVYLIGNPLSRLARVSRDGSVLRLFNISSAQAKPGHSYRPAGLALGVKHNKASEMVMYIADRGVDNAVDPAENDGLVYEVSLPAVSSNNKPAVVNAGPTQTITLPANANLDATVTDPVGDSRPTLAYAWSKVSGPGNVTFGNASAVDTTATFSAPGTYLLQLLAHDGQLISLGRVTVIVRASDGAIVLDTPISYEDDDAEQRAAGAMNLGHPTLELVRFEGFDQLVGLRFRDLAIPRGAEIKSAYIQFTVAEATSGNTSLTVRGQNVDNAPIFELKTNNISGRSTTSASASWSPARWDTVDLAGPDQRTTELKQIVQAIVDRPGWASGNAMVFIITGTGLRVARAISGDKTGAPSLHVEFFTLKTQTINVTTPAPSTAAYNTSFTVAATASSGLPVAITTTGGCTGSGSGTGDVTMTSGTDACTVHYNQAGNANYSPAPEKTDVVNAQKANQSITVTEHAPLTAVSGQSFTVAATASSGLAVAITTAGGCTGSGSGSADVTVTSGTDACTVHYNQAGDTNYNAAPEVTEDVNSQKISQTITVTTHAPATAIYNTSFTVAATASSGLPVAITTTGVCTGSGSSSASITMTSGTGTCTVHYNQAGDTDYNRAIEVTETVNAQPRGIYLPFMMRG